MRELYEADFHKPGTCGSGRAWAKASGAFRRGLSRGGRGRWADVGFVLCFLWGGIFSCFSGNHVLFSNSSTITRSTAARDPDSSQRRLLIGEVAPTVSQSAHRELAPTYPHQVYRLVCSHLRNMASSVGQSKRSSQPKPVPCAFELQIIFSSFESASHQCSRDRALR